VGKRKKTKKKNEKKKRKKKKKRKEKKIREVLLLSGHLHPVLAGEILRNYE
jgi:hypothetical protein